MKTTQQLGIAALTIAVARSDGGACALGQEQPSCGGTLRAPQVVLPEGPVELTMHRFEGLPTVEVLINGEGPMRFVLDTGAAGVLLRKDRAKAMKLPGAPGLPDGSAQALVQSPDGKAIPASLVLVKQMQLGGVELQEVRALAIELPYGESLDGIIGMDVFGDFLLTYDYPAARVRLARGELPEPNGRDILEYTTPLMPHSHPAVAVQLGADTLDCIIDTGSRAWFLVAPKLADRLKFRHGPFPGTKAMPASGELVPTKVGRLDTTLRLGRYTVPQPIVGIVEACGEMIMGTPFLLQFTVTLDGRNKRVRFARETDAPITVPPWRTAGFFLKRADRGMEVVDVHPSSHAAELGLTAGDVILTINGTAAEDLYGSTQWLDLVQQADTLELRYRRRDQDQPETKPIRVLELIP